MMKDTLKNSVVQEQSESGFANVWVETRTGRRTITTFCGAFIYANLNNMANKSALEFAAAAAALKCAKVGNREALPALEEVQKLIIRAIALSEPT